MSTRQTLRNYLSSIGRPDVSAISYASDITTGLNGTALDEGDDLGIDPNTGKQLVGIGEPGGIVPGYVGFITQQAGNEFTIDASTPTTVANSADRGVNLEVPESQGSASVFVKSSDYPAIPSYFDSSGSPIVNLVDKVGNNLTTSGPDLLAAVIPEQAYADVIGNQSKAVTSTFKMLKKYNKFTGGSEAQDQQFVDVQGTSTPTDSLNLDSRVELSFQRGAGAYQIPDDTSSKKKSLDDLKDVAHSMLLKAAGWDVTQTAASSIDPNALFDNVTPTNLASFPIINRLLNPDQVRPRESYGAPTDGDASFLANQGDAVVKIASDSNYTKSSPSVYTPEVTFSESTVDQGSVGVLRAYQAAISIISMAIIIEKTLSDKSKYFSSDMLNLGLGPYYMGTSPQTKTTATLRALSDIAIVNTGRFSYQACVRSGLTLYFGIDAGGEMSAVPDVSAAINVSFSRDVATIATPIVNQTIQERMAGSHGFWNAVARSNVRIIDLFQKSIEVGNTQLVAESIFNLLNSRALRITNVFAQIGYTYLVAHLEAPTSTSQDENITQEGKLKSAFQVDSFASLPGTRIMKSRDPTGKSLLTLAWRHSAVPSALLLPPTLLQASLDMDYIYDGPNAAKLVAATTLRDKTYTSLRIKGRIPIEVANNLENRLDAEYVPFYFHDLRTNEIIGLHAFLDTLSDNYGISYNPTQAHGRADTIKNYSNTKRSIGFSFWLVATAEEDFDEMWVKINKLVTLAYPQYTKGTMMSAKSIQFNSILGKTADMTFEQPFSQVVGGTPVIRLRIGDVIKSNYSRFNLGRLFGAGNTEAGAFSANGINIPAITNNVALGQANIFNNLALLPVLALLASPIEAVYILSSVLSTAAKGNATASAAVDIGSSIAYDALDNLLVNGFVNPLLRALPNPNATSIAFKPFDDIKTPGADSVLGKILLKPRYAPYIFTLGNESVSVKVTRPTPISIISEESPTQGQNNSAKNLTVKFSSIFGANAFSLSIDDSFIFPPNNKTILSSGATCKITSDDCLFDPDAYYSLVLAGLFSLAGLLTNVQGTLVSAASGAAAGALGATGFPVDTSFLSDYFGSAMRQFTAPSANPITYAFESSMGRGLAGVITSMQFNWLDASTLWETKWGSRAPIACKVTMAFDPIHDISPGLDYYGANRAPNYNVGAMQTIAGDPHPDNGSKSKIAYSRNGKSFLGLG